VAKNLGDLLSGFSQVDRSALASMDLSSSVVGVTSDSRQVAPGSVFVAIRGGSQDGHQFIADVQERGACLVVGEDLAPRGLQIPYLKVADPRKALAELASSFFDHPSRSLLMIGVTGTSGKTTTTYLLEAILTAAGHRVGVIGTVNFRFGSRIFPSTHTTPGAVELQGLLAEMKKAGCTAVVMEVSSHALKQERTAQIAFDGVLFTNLSPEHLDFHPDMEDYFQSKAVLFTSLMDFSMAQGKKPVGTVNEEDDYGLRLASGSFQVTRFNTRGLHVSLEGIRGEVNGIQIESGLTGGFNCSNISGAVNLAQLLKVDRAAIQKGVAGLPGVPGRLERVLNSRGVHVWVDYAHKPDALEKVLKTLRSIKKSHRLITVFGCGGDRDRKKRPVMGRIAITYSDFVFVTSDNPRTENPQTIIEEILEGVSGAGENYKVEVDRKRAIFQAIHMAKANDLVLIAGKGHEDYQILGTQKIHFDDREIATEAFQTLDTAF